MIWRAPDFDALVVIRGGGARTDLVAFDDYALAAALARAPLPVLTGIGHERDEALVDLVAHTAFKTPTAVAAFLIEQMQLAEGDLATVAQRVRAAADARLRAAYQQLVGPAQRLPLLVRARLRAATDHLALAQARLHALDPTRLLARGYTLTTTPDGRLLRTAAAAAATPELTTHFADGQVRSRVL